PDPQKVEIIDGKHTVATPPLHPVEKMGNRSIKVDNIVYISGEDAKELSPGSVLRLKDLYNIEIVSTQPLRAKHIGDSMDEVRKKRPPIVQWVAEDNLHVEVLSPEGVFTGIGELQIVDVMDKVVQFERFGFCRIDNVKENRVVAYFTHK
ncbi:MAG: glutamate--tRNA ligase, partial [Methanohalophilus sp.]